MHKQEPTIADDTCVDANTTLELLAGTLTEEKADALREHLDDCDDCRTVLARVMLALRTDEDEPSKDAEPTPMLPYPGSMIARYEVIRLVGIGGMGLVYCARDPKLDRLVALKLLRPSAGAQASLQSQLLRESKIMAGLQSSYVATIYDVGQWQGRIYVALEFAEGGTLQDWMQEDSRSWGEIRAKFLAAGKGLAAAHELGIVHGDFKPANVLLTGDDEVRVSDFGLAKYSDENGLRSEGPIEPPGARSSVSSLDSIVGTPAYMAPEQFRGEEASEQSDQFSFCLSLYEALCGARPERDESGQLVLNSSTAPTTSGKAMGELPAPVRRALMRGMANQANERFESMNELLRALEGSASIPRWGYVAGIACLATFALVWGMTSPTQSNTFSPAYEIHEQLSKRFAEDGQLTLARQSAVRAFEVATSNSDIDHQVRALLLQAQLTFDERESDRLLRRAAALAEQSEDSDLRAQAMARLAVNETTEGGDVLLQLAKGAANASPISSESREYLDLVKAGEVAISTSDDDAFVAKIDGFLESVASYQREDDDGVEASGDVCGSIIGLLETAVCYSLRASQEAVNENFAESVVLSNMALEHLGRVEGGDPCFVADVLVMRGAAYLYLDPLKAEKDFARVLEICSEDEAANTFLWAISLAECERFVDSKQAIKKIAAGALDEDDEATLVTLKEAIATKVRPTTLFE